MRLHITDALFITTFKTTNLGRTIKNTLSRTHIVNVEKCDIRTHIFYIQLNLDIRRHRKNVALKNF